MGHADLLRDALETLREESVWHHEAVGARLDGCVLAFVVDGEAFALRAEAGVARVTAGAREADLTVRTSARTALALLDAEVTVLDALMAGTLDIRGATEDLRRAEGVLSVGVHGLVRSRSGPALLARLRVLGSERG